MRRLIPVIALSLLAGALALPVSSPSPVQAAGSPDLTIAGGAPGSTLLGETVPVSIAVTNPSTSVDGFNLTYRVILPAGVTYDSGGPVAPQVFVNQPVAGQTTLIFPNVTDILQRSSATLDLRVRPAAATYPVGSTVPVTVETYVNTDARVVPTATATGAIDPTTATGTSTSTSATRITAVDIAKSEPSPEGELLRGVHQFDTVYTLTVRNNLVNATDSVRVYDFVPAGLEFLGCGTVDNTANGGVEFVGAPRLDASTTDLVSNCPAPTGVQTLSVDPDGSGPAPLGVYTRVEWTIGSLAPGATFTIRYAAGIPIRENVLFASDPGVGAIANLDNNTGPETADEQPLRNVAAAGGAYTGAIVGPTPGVDDPTTPWNETVPGQTGDRDSLLRTAEDLRVIKSASTSTIQPLGVVTWTLQLDSSQYRSVGNLDVVDTLPDSQCPLGARNYTTSGQGSSAFDELCDPTGIGPTFGGSPLEYTSAVEQSNGTFILRWDDLTMPAGVSRLLVFPSKQRLNYQEGFAPEAPVLTGDSLANNVVLTADGTRVQPENPTEVAPLRDDSSASQSSRPITLNKEVSVPAAVGTTLDCNAAAWIDADDSAGAARLYRPGDRVCYRLQVDLGTGLAYRNLAVRDLLPTGVTFERTWGLSTKTNGETANSNVDSNSFLPPGVPSNVIGPFDPSGSAASTSSNTIVWRIGSDAPALPGADFFLFGPADGSAIPTNTRLELVFSGRYAGPSASGGPNGTFLEGANLMKVTTGNTAGQFLSLREQAVQVATEPVLTIQKARTPSMTRVDPAVPVRYTLTVANTALTPDPGGYGTAQTATVVDTLPAVVDSCALVLNISDSGVCDPGPGANPTTITWTVNSLAAGGSVTRTYDVDYPDTVTPNQTVVNTARVTRYTQTDNTGATQTYTPGTNAPAATATVNTQFQTISVAKTHQSAIGEAGNTRLSSLGTGQEQATIGETINYRVTFTAPDNSTLFRSFLTDTMPAGLALVGTPTFAVTNTSGSFPVSTSVNSSGQTVIRVDFPTPLVIPDATTGGSSTGNDATFTLTYTARVRDIAANVQGATLSNTARFEWRNAATGSGGTNTSTSTRTTRIQEPNVQIDKANAGDAFVEPGEVVDYTLTVTNPSRTPTDTTSTAHDLLIDDRLPDQLTPLTAGGAAITASCSACVGAQSGDWNQTTRRITWTRPSLAPNATLSLTYSVRVANPITAAVPLTNTATIRNSSIAGTATGERITYVATDSNTVVPPGGGGSKSVTPSNATVGQVVEYTVSVTIGASLRFPDALLTDVLPDGMEFVVGSTDVSCSTSTGPCGLTTTELAPAPQPDGSTLLGFWTDDIEPAAVDRVVIVRYQAYVRDVYVGTGTPPAGSRVLAGTALVNTVQTRWNDTGRLTAAPSMSALPTFDRQSQPRTATLTVREPSMQLDKDVDEVGCNTIADTSGAGTDDDTCPTQPGTVYRYTITVRNVSTNWPAFDIIVGDTLAPELQDVVVDPLPAGVSGGQLAGELRFGIDTIPANGSVTITYTARVVDPNPPLVLGQIITNSAQVREAWGVREVVRRSNPVPTYRSYSSNTDTVDMAMDLPNPEVGKVAVSDPTDARAGVPFTWELTARNIATLARAADVRLIDTLPPGWTYDAGSARLDGDGNGVFDPPGVAVAAPTITTTPALCVAGTPTCRQVITWTLADLPAGGPLQRVRFTATPSTALLTETTTGPTVTYTNQARLDVSDGGGVRRYTDDADATARIRRADLSLQKDVSAGPHFFGGLVQYTITVTNAGPDPATNVAVEEPLTTGLLFQRVVAGPGTYDPVTGEWVIGTIPDGASVSLVLEALITGRGTQTNRAEVRASDQWDPNSTPNNGLDEDDDDTRTIEPVLSSLGDTVWLDLDGDGTQDTGEPGIPGVTIRVTYTAPGASAPTVVDVITNGTGQWGIVDLPIGVPVTAELLVTPTLSDLGTVPSFDRDGGTASPDRRTTVTLTSTTTSRLDVDFGEEPVGSLGDQVWYDRDGDGATVPALDDVPVPGVDITVVWAGFDGVLDTADDLTFTDTTDAAGRWGVARLPFGIHRVSLDPATLPAGLTVPTYDLDGIATPWRATTNLSAAVPTRDTVDFAATGAASIGDTLWLDLDGDGVQGVDEPGLSGVTIELVWDGPDGPVVARTITDLDGRYAFTNLPDGAFTVTVDPDGDTLPADLVPTVDADGTDTPGTSAVVISGGVDDLDQDFGYRGVLTLGDQVWWDRAGSGASAPAIGDVPLPGITVQLSWPGLDGVSGNGDDLIVTRVTDATGRYSFAGLPEGDYLVRLIDVPGGWVPTFDQDGVTTPFVTAVTLDGDRDDIDFALTGTGSLGDRVWDDRNGDGVQDAAEVGIPGVVVAVRWFGGDGVEGTADDVVITTVTGVDGRWSVGRLPAGGYRVGIEVGTLPSGFVVTADRDGTADGVTVVTLGAGQTLDDVDVGARPEADLSITKRHAADFRVGADGAYTITVLNAGPAVAEDVVVVDDLPAGLTFAGAGPGWSCTAAGQRVRCALTGTLDVQASAELSLRVLVGAPAAPGVTNVVTVSGSIPDPNTANDRTTDPTVVLLADLVLEKRIDGVLPATGPATYRLRVTNLGPSVVPAGVVVTDNLPPQLTAISASAPGSACTISVSTVSCRTLQPMAVGAVLEVVVDTQVDAAPGVEVVNQASITSPIPDLVQENNTSAVRVVTTAIPATGGTLWSILTLALATLVAGLWSMVIARRRRSV